MGQAKSGQKLQSPGPGPLVYDDFTNPVHYQSSTHNVKSIQQTQLFLCK